jgi:hypothetical protein
MRRGTSRARLRVRLGWAIQAGQPGADDWKAKLTPRSLIMPRSRRVRIVATLFVLFAVLAAPMTSDARAAGGLSGALAGLFGDSSSPESGDGVEATSEPVTVASSGPVSSENFRLGWYDALWNVESPPQIAAGGMSMITAYHGESAQPRTYLDAALAAGTTVMAEIPDYLVRDVNVEGVKAYVAGLKDHAALEGWHLADEPSLNHTVGPLSPENAITLYNAIKSVDPVHPISVTFASGEDARPYVPATDILQHDDYPFKAFSREFTNLDRWKRYTFWQSYVARTNGRPFIPILQAFGGSNIRPVMGYRAPTAREMRYMVYASLAAQSDSMYFWTFYRRDPTWVKNTLAPLVNQLRAMQPALTAGVRPDVVSSTNPNITATAYKDPGTGRWHIVAVNHTNATANGALDFSGELSGRDTAYRAPGAATPIVGDRLWHSLGAYEARVYTID